MSSHPLTRVYSAGSRNTIRGDLSHLWAARDLLWMLARRDVKVRYKQSLLGIAWAILQPLSLTLMFSVIFGVFLHVRTHGSPYPAFAYAAMLPWTFLANSLTFGGSSLVGNSNLLSKIYFPREVFPVAAMNACVFDFGIGAIILVGMMLYYHIAITAWLLLIPVIVLAQMLLTGAVILVLAAGMVFFRDVKFLLPLLLQLWMYATPIVYPLSVVPARYRPIYDLNPMVGIVDAYRRTVLQGQPPDMRLLSLTLGISLGLLLVSYRGFKRAEPRFADVV